MSETAVGFRLPQPTPLTVSYDSTWDVVTIDGMKFHGDFFRRMSLGIVGQQFEIVARTDKTITAKLINITDVQAPETEPTNHTEATIQHEETHIT